MKKNLITTFDSKDFEKSENSHYQNNSDDKEEASQKAEQ